ncbi:patatin-like phospholipase family protein [Candidatus Peregrinibacteria bacterium]|jgi:NTE family protein|nr:patatin-like phospholipase family protein [Candidatus Peregrinibacteria bacterium]MBT4631357.1 patatin-like phospholipase family protein [Candidatus Peregrinibacteria bacterium]MBT5517186.1 patatin-like phospholipase family protein [Candidatus Peregrinibacteria bacterium]MBT5823768.1 patatin-like phospholipase family protein [Candidatus Peregrinibacteria bacterium]
MDTSKKIGLTLGGGGAKGYAHIGVYKVLHDNNIPIAAVAGSSIGAMIGAGIAQGKSPEEIMQVMAKLVKNKKHLVSLKFLGGKGALLNAEDEYKIMEKLIPADLTFADLKIPLVVNAVDLEKGEEVIFKEGNVFKAVLASSAVPGLYPPVFYQDKLLIDGGIVNGTPVDLCKSMGVDCQIAVDLKSYSSEQNISGLIYEFYIKEKQEKKYKLPFKHHFFKEAVQKFGFPVNVMLRSLAIASQKHTDRIFADIKPEVLIHPEVNQFSIVDIEHYKQIYKRGIKAGEEALKDIKNLL